MLLPSRQVVSEKVPKTVAVSVASADIVNLSPSTAITVAPAGISVPSTPRPTSISPIAVVRTTGSAFVNPQEAFSKVSPPVKFTEPEFHEAVPLNNVAACTDAPLTSKSNDPISKGAGTGISYILTLATCGLI